MTEPTEKNGPETDPVVQDLNDGNPDGAATAAAPADKTAELEAQLAEEKKKYLYLYAEFDNYKKRAVKERSDTIKFGWEPVARNLLPILDNLERAIEHAPAGTDKALVEGLHMVANQFRDTLAKQGVTPVDSKTFDPNLHEAIGMEPSDTPAGTITKEHSRGYTLHGRLLRPARVSVSDGKKNTA